jgi:hypothetical protein
VPEAANSIDVAMAPTSTEIQAATKAAATEAPEDDPIKLRASR